VSHPDTLRSLNNLAELLRVTGAPEEAERIHRRTATDSEKLLGLASPATRASFANLASLLQDTGKPLEAERLIRRTHKDTTSEGLEGQELKVDGQQPLACDPSDYVVSHL